MLLLIKSYMCIGINKQIENNKRLKKLVKGPQFT
jgi:hypothetical protein